MELNNSFTVPVPIADAWALLLEPERVARCLPGATLESVDGDVMRGSVKVKLGPMTMSYKGTAKFIDRDDRAHTVSMDAAGKDARGSGGVKATMRMQLVEDNAMTRCTVGTELAVTGKAAQFGRGVMAEVSSRLIDEFARRLAMEAEGTTELPASEGLSTGDSAPAPDAVDLLRTVGWRPIARAVTPLIVGGAAVAVAVALRKAQARHRHCVQAVPG